ncbi:MAG: expansin C-terminal domain-related protein, partial [Archangium sp.]
VPACGAVQGFTWRWAERPDNANLRITSKDGGNRWWFAFFVKDHRYALANAEVRDSSSGAQWVPAQRQVYNAWLVESSAGLTAPLSVRLTDIHGQQVTLTDVITSFTPETTFTTTTQFPAGRGGGNPLAP